MTAGSVGAVRYTRPRGCAELGEPLGACVAECAHTEHLSAGMPTRVGRVLALLSVAVLLPVLLVLASGRGHRQPRRAGQVLTVLSRMVLRALGIQVVVEGRPRSGPGLVVANHVSWLDILVLAAAGPMVPVAKIEVRDWPLVGGLARRCGAIFLRRDNIRQLPELVTAISGALRQGRRVQVFPEATTRCGTGVDQFHRAAFQAAIDTGVVVQPVALKYLDADGRICTAASFVGDTELLPSLRRVLRLRGLTVHAHWLPVIPAPVTSTRAATDRRKVTARVERAISRDLALPVVSRLPTSPVPLSIPSYSLVTQATQRPR